MYESSNDTASVGIDWGLTAALHPTKLTGGHFDKDNFSKMRVYLSAQVVSSSVATMIKLACEDEELELHFDRSEFEPLIQFITHANNLVDIINGRHGANFTQENTLQITESLLEILSWFN